MGYVSFREGMFFFFSISQLHSRIDYLYTQQIKVLLLPGLEG